MSAVISPCGLYRYRLERGISTNPRVAAFIMVNPSTADAEQNDATIRKVIGFAERHGVGRIIVGNKFAFRSPDIKALRIAPDPVGPDNDRHLEQIMRDADLYIVAWGPLAKLPLHLRSRWQEVIRIADRVGCRFMCLGTAQDQHPRHPLMLSYDTAISDWHQPKLSN
ncbi:DUF1643 domain-containing protein [Microvirga sp. 3-52]|uniref:DUF1643 domain-containing protein n=1 Tax=Microvirga sp. 3-52 TaxID=2792425 RepID=UPI001AC6B94E|nr:DUF1643 domain-containing protein [Microvirga sp. 3-52]MBO1904617.1 DUF1643 domain-containing protein [Microvirga sp. 3-52]MBS7451847.1 DUF1643 domain-containing protein [Microvirga sp. 3-52]